MLTSTNCSGLSRGGASAPSRECARTISSSSDVTVSFFLEICTSVSKSMTELSRL